MITHVDDVDLVGKNKDSLKEIIKEVKKEWPIKEVSTEFMLGVKREKLHKERVQKSTMINSVNTCPKRHPPCP